MTHILPLLYCGSIQYYSKLLNTPCIIDTHENYVKQSLRNRCLLCGPNGLITLTVPVLKPHGEKITTDKITIDNSKQWQHEHWASIFSCYGRSPYFIHFRHLFEPIYNRPYKLLLDLNNDIHQAICQALNIDIPLNFSEEYLLQSEEMSDMRSAMSTKPRLIREDPHFKAPIYFQVFEEKNPFIKNLSILDMLFCEGRQAVPLLRDSYIK